jgi:pyruvate-formate lyase-activating enzyme
MFWDLLLGVRIGYLVFVLNARAIVAPRGCELGCLGCRDVHLNSKDTSPGR